LLTIALVTLTLFTGCRAFQPEAVVVNRPPETFLIGAPIEGGGGYFHYHMFWYGRDDDGVVEKFVWAVTDTSVQNEDTAEDEEDSRFNPALDITHLEFSHWTTKTDSIFDFQINNGTSVSADMTFHMVAVDDYGDFDRTPARLHFFSNTLGSPMIDFFRISGTDTIPLAPGVADTVGFRQPFHLYWQGSTPNILGYDSDALAAVDTVFPFDDGLYGYKWQLSGDLGNGCQPAFEDCWHPRLFNESTGDSFSYFAEINSLLFKNDASSSTNPFGMELPSGGVNVRINSLDVAGVEVDLNRRNFDFVVNHDPETILLQGRDWAHADEDDPDTNTYPYFTLLNDASQVHYPFQNGARIPDRTYVVFKALARDHMDDVVVDPDFKIGLTGKADGVRYDYTGGRFTFSSGASDLDFEPEWDAGLDGWYADTLGFLVGPRTTFTFSMQAVDEHTRRDGTPPSFTFDVGFPPCVQCLELLPNRDEGSAYDQDLECYDPLGPDHVCFGDTSTFYIPKNGLAHQPDRTYLDGTSDYVYLSIRKGTLSPSFTQDEPDPEQFYSFECRMFSFSVLLHGQDDPREAWSDALNRARGWKYQVDYACDPGNLIKDAGGVDDLGHPTFGYEFGTPYIDINPTDGVWRLTVNLPIPVGMLSNGMDLFRIITFYGIAGQDEALTDELMAICLRQFSPGTVRALALDQTECGLQPLRPAKYHMFDTVRPPRELNPGENWRDCDPNYSPITTLLLKHGTMDSAVYNDAGELVVPTQYFNVIFEDGTDVQCGWTPAK